MSLKLHTESSLCIGLLYRSQSHHFMGGRKKVENESDLLNFAAMELIQLLMGYEAKGAILEGLVCLLRPTTNDIQQQLDIFSGQ